MTRRRPRGVLVALLALIAAWSAQPDAHRAATSPFLWEGRHGATRIALFGTIHVPDARVLALPEVVKSALARSDRVVTEVPLDAAAQANMAMALMLPNDQRLRAIIGDERFARLEARVRTALGSRAPLAVPLLVGMLDKLKPWAAMAQLASLDYLPDLLDGRTSLDAQLYADAQAAGKKVGGLETVAEQAGTFDVFTTAEQTALLDAALRELEEPTGAPTSAMLVEWYLSGEDAKLASALAHTPGDEALARKFEAEVLVARNHRMAQRIEALLEKAPDEALFVAVGALHLVGPENLPQLLKARGCDIARVRQ